MLTSLYIQNIAVIHKATIHFGPGLNVFTGETGAGKTILISAIDAVLGERATRDIIRTGEEKAVVSALFEDLCPAALFALRELGYEDDEGGVLITREITAAGKSSCKINGMPATASVLKQVASLLIHIHGQRDAQQLLSPERHIELVDAFGGHGQLLEEYRAAYSRLMEIQHNLSQLNMDEKQKAQRVDMLTYQIAEIEAAGLSDPDEEDELVTRKKLIGAGEKVLESLSCAYEALSGDNEGEGIVSRFGDLTSGVGAAADYIASLLPMRRRLEEIGYELEDFASELRRQLDGFEFDPRELHDIEYRLDLIYRLKRKYGADIASVLEFYEQARNELETITSSEERMAELNRSYSEAIARAKALARDLTGRREKAADAFLDGVERELAFLDMPNVSLSVRREEKPLSADGQDDIAFFVSTNVGEEPRPLSKIASGGEISRMMLSMKNVLADRDAIGTLIFDEVDIGVSGRAAQKIGRKLSQVAKYRQVICVTHLAQVAAFADLHLLIRKEVEDGRTFTRVEELPPELRARELARIISGDAITETAMQNARELIAHAEELKPA